MTNEKRAKHLAYAVWTKSSIKMYEQALKQLEEATKEARHEGFHGGREWMKQGREFASGWLYGLQKAFDYLDEPRDERFMILSREITWPEKMVKTNPH